MTDGRLLGAGLAALAGAAAMLLHPDVPVGVLGGTEPAPGLLVVFLLFSGAGLAVAAGAPPVQRWGAAAATCAMLVSVPLLVLLPDWAGPSYPAVVLGGFVATHLLVAPLAARAAGVGPAVLRRAAAVSGGVHALLAGGLFPRLASEDIYLGLFALVGALFFGLLAWGLGTAGSVLLAATTGRAALEGSGPDAGRGTGQVPGERPTGDRRVRAGLLLASAVLLVAVGSLFVVPGTTLWTLLVVAVAPLVAAGLWSWPRTAA